MSDCCKPFQYQFSSPRIPIEGNGPFLYPCLETGRWIYLHASSGLGEAVSPGLNQVNFGIWSENPDDTDGYLYAWGGGDRGQLGNGSYRYAPHPQRIGNSRWKHITTHDDSVLAVRSDGSLWAWGVSSPRNCVAFSENSGYSNSSLESDTVRAFTRSSVESATLAVFFRQLQTQQPMLIRGGTPKGTMPPLVGSIPVPIPDDPTIYWAPGGGFMREPTLEVVTLSGSNVLTSPALELLPEEDAPVGTRATVEPLFDAAVVGELDVRYDDQSTGEGRWDLLGLMPIVTNGGTEYTSPPTVTLSGGGGSGATARAEITGGQVTKLIVTSGGSGYTTPPTVSFQGGGGRNATAQVQILGRIYGFKVTAPGGGYSHSFHVPEISDTPGTADFFSFAIRQSVSDTLLYWRNRIVVVKAVRHSADNFVQRVLAVPNASQRDAFRRVPGAFLPSYVGVCRLSPSPVFIRQHPGKTPRRVRILFPRSTVDGRIIDEPHPNDRIFEPTCVEVRSLDGDGGAAAAGIAEYGPWDGEYRNLVVGQPAGIDTNGGGYRSEPEIFLGPQNFPILVDEGPGWKTTSLDSSACGGLKEDGSIWFWGTADSGTPRDYRLNFFQTANSARPTPLGGTLRATMGPAPAFFGNQNIGTQISGIGYTSVPDVNFFQRYFYCAVQFRDFIGDPEQGATWAANPGVTEAQCAALTNPICPPPSSGGGTGGDSQFGGTGPGTTGECFPSPIQNTAWVPSDIWSFDTPPSSPSLPPVPVDVYSLNNFSPNFPVEGPGQGAPEPNLYLYGPVAGAKIYAHADFLYVIDPEGSLWQIQPAFTGSNAPRRRVDDLDRPLRVGAVRYFAQAPNTPTTATTVSIPYRMRFGVNGVVDSVLTARNVSGTLFGYRYEPFGSAQSLLEPIPPGLSAYMSRWDGSRGLHRDSISRCGGRWTDYDPVTDIGRSTDGVLKTDLQFYDIDDEFFSGFPLPPGYIADMGSPPWFFEGSLVVSDGRIWRLPDLRNFSRPPGRLAPFNVRLGNGDTGGVVFSPGATTTQHPDTARVSVEFNGQVHSLGVIDGGSGYRVAPPIEITSRDGYGADAAGFCVIEGPIESATVTAGGDNYSSPPEVVFSQPGIPALASCTIKGRLSSIVIESAGSGYTSAPLVDVIGDGQGAAVTATITGGGGVSELLLISRGAEYTFPPVVEFSGGGGSGASATAQINSDGWVESLTLTSAGSNYVSEPQVVLRGGTEGTNVARATAKIASNGRVTSLQINSPGSDYTTPPTIRFREGGILPGGQHAVASASIAGRVDTISIKKGGTYRFPPTFSFAVSQVVTGISRGSPGSGYSSPPRVTLAGGQGSGASAVALLPTTLSSATVVVTAGGSGYTSPPVVKLVGGGGAFAKAVATVGGGAVTGVTITVPGNGYLSAPSVEFFGGGGSGASATITLPVDSIILTAPGSGYTSPPTVVFQGGGGTGAAATATIGAAPGSGGGGVTLLNGSIIHARITNPGDGYQVHPVVTVPPPPAPGGRPAWLQGKIIGEVISAQLDHAGAGYLRFAPSVFNPSNLTYPASFSALSLAGPWRRASNTTGDSRHGPIFAMSADSRQLPNTGPSPILSVSLNNQSGHVGLLWNQKPVAVFPDTITVLPTIDMTLANISLTRQGYDTRIRAANPVSVAGVGGSGEETEILVPSFVVDRLPIVENNMPSLEMLLGSLETYFHDHRYTVPPVIRFFDVTGQGLQCDVTLDASGFVSGLALVQASAVDYTNELRAMFYGGVPRVVMPTATCEVGPDGRISAVRLTTQGSGFSRPPLVYVAGGGGDGAVIEVVRMTREFPESSFDRRTMKVAELRIASAGSGYTSVPSVVFVHQEPKLPETATASGDDADESLLRGQAEYRNRRRTWSQLSPSAKAEYIKIAGQTTWRSIANLNIPSATASSIGGDIAPYTSVFHQASLPDDLGRTVRTQYDPVADVGASGNPGHEPVFMPFFSDGVILGGTVNTIWSSLATQTNVPRRRNTPNETLLTDIHYHSWRVHRHVPQVSLVHISMQVKEVNVIVQGRGYTSPPRVVFTGGGGGGASATAVLGQNGRVVRVVVDAGGAGYTYPPTVFLDPLPPTGGFMAVAVAVLSQPPALQVIEVGFTGAATPPSSSSFVRERVLALPIIVP
jgi:hypothetical protein